MIDNAKERVSSEILTFREYWCYVTNVKLFACGERNTRMIDNIKENDMKERVSAAGKDIGMEDLVLLCGLVAKVGKR